MNAQITGHDSVVGELLTAIDELGLADNTLVFYSSDNGPAPPSPTPGEYHEEKNAMGSAGSWNGRKNSYYDGGIRMPCLVRWPGHVPAGRVDKDSAWTAGTGCRRSANWPALLWARTSATARTSPTFCLAR